MIVVYPPDKIYTMVPEIFLAGSIENGSAEFWQDKFVERFEDYGVVFYNPRRKDWNPNWDHDSLEFVEQVKWELEHIDKSDYVVMYFDPNTKSPISLLELGILCGGEYRRDHVFVCCPEGFYRKGNVKITCERFGITVYNTIDAVVERLKWELY